MKKLMKKLPLIAFIVAIGAAFAFNAPNETVEETHWFEYDGSTIGEYIGTDASTVCPDFVGDACALGFDEEDVETNGNEAELKPGVDETNADDEAFKLE